MDKDKVFGVALTKSICPCCCSTTDDTIIMNTSLTKKWADKVKSLHGQVTETQWCKDCQAVVDGGGVWLIEVDPDKSKSESNGMLKIENAHRTGRVWAIRREAAERIFNQPPEPMVFIDPQAAEKIGLPDHGGGADGQDTAS